MACIHDLVWMLIVSVCTSTALENVNFNVSDRIKLEDHLKFNYDPRYMGSIEVKWTTQLFEVLEVDKNCFMTVDVILKLSWKDDQLTWDPSKLGGIQIIHRPIDEIWKPKFDMQYSAGHDKMIVSDKIASVSHEGHVTWIPHLRLRSLVPTDFTHFPFDGHKVRISLLSWYPASVVKFSIDGDKYEDWKFLNPGIQWDIRSADVKPRNLVDNGETYSGVSYVLRVERRHTYHAYIIILPAFVTGMLILLIMLLPHKSRFIIGSSLLFSLLIISSMLQDVLPSGVVRVPIIALILAYEYISLLIVFLISTTTYYIMRRDSRVSKVPWLMKQIFMNKLTNYFANFSSIDSAIPLKVTNTGPSISYRQLSEEEIYSSTPSIRVPSEQTTESTIVTNRIPKVRPCITDEKNDWIQLADIVDKSFLFVYSILSAIIVTKICLPSDIPAY